MGLVSGTLLKILKCPDCGGKIDGYLKCGNCKRAYEYNDYIYEFLPREQLPFPPIYSDPDYVKYNSVQSTTYDYLYSNRNFIINWVQNSGYRQISKLLGKREGLMLECGCGIGMLACFNPNIGLSDCIMFDIDKKSLSLIKMKDRYAGVINGTAYKLPFQDSSFDTVISHAQLEHLCYLDWALYEIKRVLKPQGKFLASIPTEGGFLWQRGRELTSARHFSRKLGIDYIKSNRIDHFNTIYQIERAIRRYFRIEKRILFPFRFPSFHLNFTCTYMLSHL